MGFSTVAAQLLFFIAVVAISAGVIAVFSGYVDQATNAMSDKQQYISGQLRTDVRVTNVDNSSGHLYVYVKNVGNQQIKTNCTELYVDNGWVSLTASNIQEPSTSNPAEYLSPEGTMVLKAPAVELSGSSVHEVKFITCNGISDTENF